jgi:hypothetical protein
MVGSFSKELWWWKDGLAQSRERTRRTSVRELVALAVASAVTHCLRTNLELAGFRDASNTLVWFVRFVVNCQAIDLDARYCKHVDFEVDQYCWVARC